jgi:SAM-dependent methyltransferase
VKGFTPKAGRTLVVGSRQYNDKADRRRFYPDAIGVDMRGGPGVDVVHDLENPLPEIYGKFDHVDCASVLEHVRRPWLLCANIESLLTDGATVFITVPFVWRVHGYPSDYWRMTAEALPVLFPHVEWSTVYYESGGVQRDQAPSIVQKNCRFFQKTEVIAFGTFRGFDN